MRSKMDELNERSNALLDNYRADEGHNLSHTISKLNALWSKFNDKWVFAFLFLSLNFYPLTFSVYLI